MYCPICGRFDHIGNFIEYSGYMICFECWYACKNIQLQWECKANLEKLKDKEKRGENVLSDMWST